MNQRIRDLAVQAGAGINYTDNGEPFGVHFNKYETFEKFAELIVRECADIAWKDSARYATFDNDTVMNGKADVLALCSHHIKQHFGVEE